MGEEELQLQLAMAMSREEAEQEEAKRRSDDVRLQLALSQSENDFKLVFFYFYIINIIMQILSIYRKGDPVPPKQESHFMDLLDISLGATNISSPPPDAWGMKKPQVIIIII